MSKALVRTLIAVISILLLTSLVCNWIQYKYSRKTQSAVYGRFEFVLEGVNRTNDIFSGKLKNQNTMDAVVYLAEAAGQFQAFSYLIEQMGINHTMGIGMELEKEAQVISHPKQYSKSQIQQSEKFVEFVATELVVLSQYGGHTKPRMYENPISFA
ncbi:hypothetical protein [Alicyclobacillus fodiniaquatilis]|uniref:Uncharacterized protein n=1 Tax=Alicyclobacillus fodiniaquatilis TaxID=1661150 RepID=A0ABW4JNE1_9BACL